MLFEMVLLFISVCICVGVRFVSSVFFFDSMLGMLVSRNSCVV